MAFPDQIRTLLRRRQRSRGSRVRRCLNFVEPLESRAVLATVELGNLGAGGTTIFGQYGIDNVSEAGDVNGDGYDDYILGTIATFYPSRSYAGELYLVYGGSDQPATLNITAGQADVRILGMDSFDQGGIVTGGGDINGDGFDDLVFSANRGNALNTDGPNRFDAGITSVIFGGNALPAAIDLRTLGATGGPLGFVIQGAGSNNLSGTSTSIVGDVDGDGFDDLLIGAHMTSQPDNILVQAGEAYLVYGRASYPRYIDLLEPSEYGVRMFGQVDGGRAGYRVGGGGDVNGDGYSDLLIGFSNSDSFLMYGSPNLPSTVNLTAGPGLVKISGASNNSISDAGDINGDGFSDMLVGSPYDNVAYLIYGGLGLPATINLLSLGALGVVIAGEDFGDFTGAAVSSAGDVNGDGYDDLIVGSPWADGISDSPGLSEAGEAAVVFGGPALPQAISLSGSSARNVTFVGIDFRDSTGISVSGAGDIDGDGFDDVLIAAPGGDGPNNETPSAGRGEGCLIFGRDFSSIATHVGTLGPDTLTGNGAANVMLAGAGDDNVVGGGGGDVLRGGAGDDVLTVSDLHFQRVHGGRGTDTLRLDASNLTLDLTAIPRGRITGIEQIDLGGQANTLIITFSRIGELLGESRTLFVLRSQANGDVVTLDAGWTRGADSTVDGLRFETFSQGLSRVLIQADFSRADLNSDGAVDPQDIAFAVYYFGLFGPGSMSRLPAGMPQRVDYNGDAELDSQDVLFVLYEYVVTSANGEGEAQPIATDDAVDEDSSWDAAILALFSTDQESDKDC